MVLVQRQVPGPLIVQHHQNVVIVGVELPTHCLQFKIYNISPLSQATLTKIIQFLDRIMPLVICFMNILLLSFISFDFIRNCFVPGNILPHPFKLRMGEIGGTDEFVIVLL